MTILTISIFAYQVFKEVLKWIISQIKYQIIFFKYAFYPIICKGKKSCKVGNTAWKLCWFRSPYRHIYVCEWSTTEAAITLNVSLHVTWMGVLLQLSYSRKKVLYLVSGRRYLRRRRNEKFSFVRNHQAFPWEESLKSKQIKVYLSRKMLTFMNKFIL